MLQVIFYSISIFLIGLKIVPFLIKADIESIFLYSHIMLECLIDDSAILKGISEI